MRLFQTKGADAAYDRWQEPPNIHEEDGCLEICHRSHRVFNEVHKDCGYCADEKCRECDGKKWVADDRECGRCQGTGWDE